MSFSSSSDEEEKLGVSKVSDRDNEDESAVGRIVKPNNPPNGMDGNGKKG